MAGPGQSDVREPAFLLHLARVVQGPGMREDAFLEPADEDDIELQAFGGVQRDERDLVRIARVRVLVRHQCCLLEQPVERVAWIKIAIAVDDFTQLEQVGPAILAVL